MVTVWASGNWILSFLSLSCQTWNLCALFNLKVKQDAQGNISGCSMNSEILCVTSSLQKIVESWSSDVKVCRGTRWSRLTSQMVRRRVCSLNQPDLVCLRACRDLSSLSLSFFTSLTGHQCEDSTPLLHTVVKRKWVDADGVLSTEQAWEWREPLFCLLLPVVKGAFHGLHPAFTGCQSHGLATPSTVPRSCAGW